MEKQKSQHMRWVVLPWLILAFTVPASLFVYFLVQDSVEDVAKLRFEREADDANAVVKGRLRSYSDVLYGLRALFASETPVDRMRFHRFVEALQLKQRFPGFIALNFAALVPDADKHRFEETVRRDTSLDARGYPSFTIKPPGKRPEYYVLVYIEPLAGYEFALGLDLGANPMAADPEKVAATVLAQRDSGALITSAQPLRVPRARETIFLAMRLAVYRSGMPVRTVEERRAAYLGSVGAGFDVEYLIRGALGEEMPRHMRVRLYDAGPSSDNGDSPTPAADRRLLFDSEGRTGDEAGAAERRSDNAFVHVLPVEFASRLLEFHYSVATATMTSATDRILPIAVLAGGLISGLLLFGVLYSLSHARTQAMKIAEEMTDDLRHTTDQLQALSRRLVDVQESDRRQFSRELHDRVGQNLTALSLNLDILKAQLPGDSNQALRSRLDDAAALLESTTSAIENVMSDLRPPMLDDYGLLPAIQWYTTEFARRTGIEVSVEGDDQLARLPQASEIALFRIVQEALNNVVKHAHASRVHIMLERSNSHLLMAATDDGIGYSPSTGNRRRPGLGMVTMRERAQAVGGEFEMGPAPGRGTRISVRIPC